MRLLLSAVSLMFAVSAAAHHSMPALFDAAADIEVEGVVTDFEFIAPHGFIHLDVTDENGDVIAWELETYPPGMLIRKGLTPDALPIGERISAVGHPALDGRPLMRLLTITMSDGEVRVIQ
ncbi:MAG: DUF6152 family protein [Gammaproteobacteria bacterium]